MSDRTQPSTHADAARHAIGSLNLPPLTEAIFERTGWVPLTACIAARARLHPNVPAVREVRVDGTERAFTWLELHNEIDVVAGVLAERGAHPGSCVVVALPNGADHVLATHAAWRLGATVAPLDPTLPAAVRSELLDKLAPTVIVGPWPDVSLAPADWQGAAGSTRVPAYRLANPHAVLTTGGSIGGSRLVVQHGSLWGRLDEPPERLRSGYGLAAEQVQLVMLPLHHGFAFGYANLFGLAYGHSLVIMERFDAETALAMVEQVGIEYLATTPTAMIRMQRAASFADRDLSMLQALLHGAAPCPPEVKRAWINRLGATHVYEAYGATDVSIDCTIRGDEWLQHLGSVGRPVGCDIEIHDRSGHRCPPGKAGQILVRPVDRRSAHPRVIGADPSGARDLRPTGDIGYVDDDGYVYVLGRDALSIVTGGVNVHAETVELVLLAHPAVRDAAVVGVPDEDLGEAVHALVCLADGCDRSDAINQLLDWCREHLPREHVPRSISSVVRLPRTDTGKLQRDKVSRLVHGSHEGDHP